MGRLEGNIPRAMRVILSDMNNNKFVGKKKSISLLQYPFTGYYMYLVCTGVSSLQTLNTRGHKLLVAAIFAGQSRSSGANGSSTG